MSQNLSWLGSQLSLFPPNRTDGTLNLVSGIQAVNSRLIQLLLTRKGEDPLHPSIGFAHDLFVIKSSRDPYLYTHNLLKELNNLNFYAKIGVEGFKVRVYDPPQSSTLEIQILYIPTFDPTNQVLTYGFWEYVDAFNGNNIARYLETVQFGSAN